MFALTWLRLLITVVVGVASAALLALAAFSSTASAEHSWEEYHWGRTSNPFPLQLDDNVTPNWDSYLATASSNWSQSTALDTTTPYSTNNKRCAATGGKVEVCNARYGFNDWLGVATIWISNGHIVQGTVKVNDSYYDTAKYNTPGWRNMVMCQEIGHTLGLGHVNENFDDPNTGSCMDYTNNPDASPNNWYPNQHDYEQLETIYSHTGESNTYGSATAASRLPAAARDIDTGEPAQRGRLIHRSANGGVELYERDFGGGNRALTRVIRAVEVTPAPETTSPGADQTPAGRGGTPGRSG
jgi:hypothetical protein